MINNGGFKLFWCWIGMLIIFLITILTLLSLFKCFKMWKVSQVIWAHLENACKPIQKMYNLQLGKWIFMRRMLTRQKTFIDVQKDHKVFTNQITKEFKIQPTSKAKLCNPLCCMNSMLIVRLALLIDVKKMEHSLQMGYRKGDKIFYVSSTNNKGVEKFVILELFDSWDIHCQAKNVKFEEYFKADLDLQKLSNMIFLYGMATISYKLGCLTLIECIRPRKIGMWPLIQLSLTT